MFLLVLWLTLFLQKAISANSFVFPSFLLSPASLISYCRIGQNMFTETFVNFELDTDNSARN